MKYKGMQERKSNIPPPYGGPSVTVLPIPNKGHHLYWKGSSKIFS